MSKRRHSQFTISAESVQGNPEATVTFRALLVRTVNEIRTTGMRDTDLLRQQIVAWTGIVDDEGRDLPSPSDEPDVLGDLYIHEQSALVQLLMQGPEGDSAKN